MPLSTRKTAPDRAQVTDIKLRPTVATIFLPQGLDSSETTNYASLVLILAPVSEVSRSSASSSSA